MAREHSKCHSFQTWIWDVGLIHPILNGFRRVLSDSQLDARKILAMGAMRVPLHARLDLGVHARLCGFEEGAVEEQSGVRSHREISDLGADIFAGVGLIAFAGLLANVKETSTQLLLAGTIDALILAFTFVNARYFWTQIVSARDLRRA
jgi:hypothetical protein